MGRLEKCELDVGAPKTRFTKDPTHDRVVEDRQNEVLELDLQKRRRSLIELRVLVIVDLHKVEGVRVAALVGLGALDGSHEGVRHRRSVVVTGGAAAAAGGGFGGGEAVEGDADGELEGAELEAGGDGGGGAGSADGIAEGGGREGQEGGDGVEGGRLRVATAARHRHGVVESTRRLVRQALPRCANRHRHRRRACIDIIKLYK